MAIFRGLFCTDTHYSGKRPDCRTDEDFMTTQKNKTQEIFKIAKDNKCNIILHGGDFFDSPDISDNVAGEFGSMYLTAGIPVYVIAGNHDLRGNNYPTINQTKLGLIARLGAVKLIDKQHPIVFRMKDGKRIKITASPSDFGIDTCADEFISKKKPDDDFLIHIAHGMLLKKSPQHKTTYVPLSDIQDKTDADITFVGHYHLGFETTEANGKYFVNPGAVIRRYAFLEEMERVPEVSVFSIDTETGEISVKNVPLSCAADGSEAISRERLEKEIEYSQKIEDFKNSIIKDTATISDNIENIINEAAEASFLEDDVRKEINARIADAKAVIDSQIFMEE